MTTRRLVSTLRPLLATRNTRVAFTTVPKFVPRATQLSSYHSSSVTMSAPAPATEKPVAAASPVDGKQQKQKKEKKAAAVGPNGPVGAEINPPPEFFQERIKIFDEYMAKYKTFVAEQPRSPITITLPDGKEVQGTAWETTPLEVAKGIAASLADRVIIAKVNNQELWDLNRPLESSVSLALLDFDSPDNDYEARQVFWHSSAHVLGEACERSYEGCCLGYGPPLAEGGFFYDMGLANNKTINEDDYKQIEEVAKKAVKEKQPFERLSLPKEVLLEMFKVRTVIGRANDSTTSTSSTTSTRRSPMAPSPLCTAVDLSSTCVSVLMFLILAVSRPSTSQR